MRVLLDESIPVDLARELSAVGAQSVGQLDWAGLKNGALLLRAGGAFDALLTMDKNLPFQQNLAAHAIAVVLVRARSNRIEDLLPLVPTMIETLNRSQPGKLYVVGA